MKAMEADTKYGWKNIYNSYFDDLLSFEYAPISDSRNTRLMRLHLKKAFSDSQSKAGTSERNHVLGPNTTRVRIHKNLSLDGLPFWPLEVSLCEFSVDDLPSFETVSYVYGPPEQCAIICNGQRLFVTRNCVLALYHLACDIGKTENGFIWVDQVCINQRNPIEKGQQVALMASIYGSSARTAAWLGEAGNSLEELFDTYNKPTTAMLIGHENGLPFQQAGIGTLFSNAWFRRGWVIQEAALSRNLELFCGRYVIAWSTLIDFYRESLVWPRWILPDRETVYRFHQLRQSISASDTRRISVRQALDFTLQTSVSDQRDRLYALYGICKTISDLLGPPDYTISPGQLYLKFICAVTNKYGPNSALLWQIITIYGIGLDDTSELPSWAPDFSRGKPQCLIHPLSRIPDFEPLAQDTSLDITHVPDNISQHPLICQCVELGDLGNLIWDRPHDLHSALMQDPNSVQRILDVNDLHEYCLLEAGPRVQVNYGRPGDLLYRIVQDTPADSGRILPFNNAPEWQHMSTWVCKPSWLAVAPVAAAPGDKIVLLQGNILSGQLSVVRRCESDRWKYVGTCFVLGWKRQDGQKVIMELGTCGIELC